MELTGRMILVVEDEPVVSLDVTSRLEVPMCLPPATWSVRSCMPTIRICRQQCWTSTWAALTRLEFAGN
jgi:hypothetical protein